MKNGSGQFFGNLSHYSFIQTQYNSICLFLTQTNEMTKEKQQKQKNKHNN